MLKALDVLQISSVIPVVSLDNIDDALPLAEALLNGGIGVIEVTLRTKNALKIVESIASKVPDMRVGAGTVTDKNGFKNAVDSGAEFIFSPGISHDIIEYSKETNIALIPGVATASEVMLAQNSGFNCCKLFPATAIGGVELLKAFNSPFASMKFCPTGGISLENMNSFLSLPNVLSVGGSWIVPKKAIEDKNFQKITKLSKEAMLNIN